MIELFNVSKGDKIAIAVSGGVDSVCLFHLLLSSKEKYNLKLCVINIEHGIRGEESKNDSNFVKELCEKNGVEFFGYCVDAVKFSKDNGYSLEQGARILRYDIFNEFISNHKGYKIATAHHKTDNIETVLFNLFRGSGLKGVAGIDEYNENYLRPLIRTSKEEIVKYVKDNGFSFVTDSTNEDVFYSRNYIRNKIIPLITEKFPMAIDNVSRFSELAMDEDAYLDSLASRIIIHKSDCLQIPVNAEPVLIKRAVILIFKELGFVKDYEKVHIDSILNLVNQENGKEITLPKSIVAIREYNVITIFIRKVIEKNTLEAKVQFDKWINLGTCEVILSKSKLDIKCKELFLNGSKIPENAVIRFRKDGDTFTKFGGGTKKIKDYFIDKKIPKKDRDAIPVIAVDDSILLIFGIEIGESLKIDLLSDNMYYAYVKQI